jgi:hypothetical protein
MNFFGRRILGGGPDWHIITPNELVSLGFYPRIKKNGPTNAFNW